MDLFGELHIARSAPLPWLRALCDGHKVLAAGRFSVELLDTIGATGTSVVSTLGGATASIGNKAIAIQPKELLEHWDGHSLILLSEVHWSGYIIHEIETLCAIAGLLNAIVIMPCQVRNVGLSCTWKGGFSTLEDNEDNGSVWCRTKEGTLHIDLRGALTPLWLVAETLAATSAVGNVGTIELFIDGKPSTTISVGQPIHLPLPVGVEQTTISFKLATTGDAKSEANLSGPQFAIKAGRLVDGSGKVFAPTGPIDNIAATIPKDIPDVTLDELFWRRRLHGSGFQYVDIIAVDPSGNQTFELGLSHASTSFPTPIAENTGLPAKAARVQDGSFTWLVGWPNVPDKRFTHSNENL
jgi:hypothetical protein